MKKSRLLTFALAGSIMALSACKKNSSNSGTSDVKDKLIIVTTINNGTAPISYLGISKDLNVTNFTNAKSRQFTYIPFIYTLNDDIFAMPNRGGDIIRKYKRGTDGTLTESGSLQLPTSSQPLGLAIESDTRAYTSLYGTGKIIVFNPSTMTVIRTIDLTTYAKGDGNPDPANIVYRNGKVYVACAQTSDTYTSSNPAQILIIDVNNNDQITSATDSRTSWAGNIDCRRSMFFNENGDLYINCVGSYGYIPGQKSGFLRIRNGQTSFDSSYFLNVTDAVITGSPAVNYFHFEAYAGNGTVYATGNLPSLVSNPPNYVTDRSYGAFSINLQTQKITKINIPNSNGYAGYVVPFENKILFTSSSVTGVGIYTFDPATGTASTSPAVVTQGDPTAVEVF